MLFKKSQRALRLSRQSWVYFRRWRKLLVLPTIGRGFLFMILTLAALLIWAIRINKSGFSHWSALEILGFYLGLLLAMGLGNIVSLYCNAALIACLLQEERGDPIHLREGFHIARRRLWIIVSYTLIHFLYNIANVAFSHKLKQSPRMKKVLSGLNWPTATFLFSPVMINEPMDLGRTVQRSSRLMHDHYGKNPRITYSFFWISTASRLLACIPSIVGSAINKPASIAIGITLTYLLLLVIAIFLNAVMTVLSQALYQYIAHQKVIHFFREKDLSQAIMSTTPG